jgi:hypothetical protein
MIRPGTGGYADGSAIPSWQATESALIIAMNTIGHPTPQAAPAIVYEGSRPLLSYFACRRCRGKSDLSSVEGVCTQ